MKKVSLSVDWSKRHRPKTSSHYATAAKAGIPDLAQRLSVIRKMFPND